MIQNYPQLKQNIKEFNSEFSGTGQIQKLFSSAYYVCLTVRFPGKTACLYLGRGNHYEGFWHSEKKIPAILRKRDRFLEFLRSYLGGAPFTGISLSNHDRILILEYIRGGKRAHFMLFYHGREARFANCHFDTKSMAYSLFCSWKKRAVIVDDLYDERIFDEVGRSEINKEGELHHNLSIHLLLRDEVTKVEELIGGKKRVKFLKRKEKNILGDLKKVDLWPHLQELALKEADFSVYGPVFQYDGIRIRFQSLEHYKRRDQVFQKVKKLQRADKILRTRLKDTQQSLEKLKNRPEVKDNPLKVVAPMWDEIQEDKILKIEKQEQEYRLHVFSQYKIGVGISARGNDALRKEWANKDDWWFHLEEGTSPHLIIKGEKKAFVLDTEVFQEVGKLLREYSSMKLDEYNVIFTQVKNLKGVKGKAGSVTYKKEKHFKILLP